VSPATDTFTTWLVTPGAKVSVPDFDVKSTSGVARLTEPSPVA
jgi:hypothetical protein